MMEEPEHRIASANPSSVLLIPLCARAKTKKGDGDRSPLRMVVEASTDIGRYQQKREESLGERTHRYAIRSMGHLRL
jgi:hypothetical protein